MDDECIEMVTCCDGDDYHGGSGCHDMPQVTSSASLSSARLDATASADGDVPVEPLNGGDSENGEDAGAGGGRLKACVGYAATTATVGFLGIFPFVPLLEDSAQQRTLAVLLASMTAWLFELVPIAVTAMLIGPALVLYNVMEKEKAFAPYADPLLFLFYGAFFMGRSMVRHGLDRRLGDALRHSRLVRGSPLRIRLASMLCGAALSMWISNSATAAILIPVVVKMSADEDGASVAGSVLAVAYACSIGGTGTIIGTPPNLIALRLLESEDVHIDFVQWMYVGLPTAAALILLTFAMFRVLHPLARAAPRGAAGVEERLTGCDSPASPASPSFGRRWSVGEKATLGSFAVGVVGWVLPPVVKGICGEGSPAEEAVHRSLHVGVVGILAATVLFVVRDEKGERVLPWSVAATADWGIIMLFGGGISLGTAMKDTGLAAKLGSGFVDFTGITSLWEVTAIFTMFTVFFTEVCSNTASANVLVPLVIGVCRRLQVSPVPPCLGVSLAASCAFMMPISTGPNAIAFSTGVVPFRMMLKTGFFLNVAACLVLVLLLRVLCPLYGWDRMPPGWGVPSAVSATATQSLSVL